MSDFMCVTIYVWLSSLAGSPKTKTKSTSLIPHVTYHMMTRDTYIHYIHTFYSYAKANKKIHTLWV